MPRTRRNYQFTEGDLLEVAPLPKYMEDILEKIPDFRHPIGPRIPGHRTAMDYDFPIGLNVSNAKKSKWHTNYKLYVEVMTVNGPRVAWCSTFKMRKTAEENK